MARRGEHLVRPERNVPIALRTGEPDTLICKACAQAPPARDRINQEKAQAGDLLGILHETDGSDISAVHFGNPAAIVFRVVLTDEVGDDLRAKALKILCPAILLRVQLAVPGDHPAEIAGPRVAKDDLAFGFGL